MKYKKIIKLIEELSISWKLVNDTVVIYPDDYNTSNKGNYLELGNGIINEETDSYDEFEFSDNFDVIPENLKEWLTIFAEDGTHEGYDNA